MIAGADGNLLVSGLILVVHVQDECLSDEWMKDDGLRKISGYTTETVG